MLGTILHAAARRAPPRVTSTYTLLKLRDPAADTSPMVPSREQGIWMLERLVAGAVRYGHDLAVVHLAVSEDADDPTLAARLGAALRGADSLIRWEPGVYVALLPDTGAEGAAVAAGRLREAAASDVAVGHAHWQGDTAPDLLERSARALERERETLAS